MFCSVTALVLANVISHALRLLLRLPVYISCTLTALVFACFNIILCGCHGVCMCNDSFALAALAPAFSILHAVWRLWCSPVSNFLHSDCSGVWLWDMLYTQTALALACVIFVALWLLLCLTLKQVLHYDCSGVCLCNRFCAMNALVLACKICHALCLLLRLPV